VVLGCGLMPSNLYPYIAQLDYNGNGAGAWGPGGYSVDNVVERITAENSHLVGVGYRVYRELRYPHPNGPRWIYVGQGEIGVGFKLEHS